MSGAPLTAHEAIVRKLGVKYRAERSGCGAALFRELSHRYDLSRDQCPPSLVFYRPDLFLIEPDEGMLTVWEVEVCSPLTRKQIETYAAIEWFLYDNFEWKTRLRVVDRYGNENAMTATKDDAGTWRLVTEADAARAWRSYLRWCDASGKSKRSDSGKARSVAVMK